MSNYASLSRRQFLSTSALAAASQVLPRSLYANSTQANTSDGSTLRLIPFSYNDVQFAAAAEGATIHQVQAIYSDLGKTNEVTFTSNIHDAQLDQAHSVLMNLTDDQLLKPFRARAGQSAPGPDMGGWYDAYAFCPGHTLGQWISALSRYYAITGDDATHEKITSLVRGLSRINDPQGTFFKDNRFAGYITEKLNCGLTDAAYFGKCPEATEFMEVLTKRVDPYLPEKALSRAEQTARPHKDVTYTWDETYTLPENYFLAWRRTGDSRYHDMAVRFIYHDYFNPLAQGENVLPGKHAYSHLNALNSAAQAYLALNDKTYLQAAVNGFEMIRQQSYATGGWGPDEAFVVPGRGNLGKSLTNTHHSFETPCGAYGEFKLTRDLLSITADPRYGDEMERVMYNTILGARPLSQDGASFYYSDYNSKAKKVYHEDMWPCCSGTITQIAADYRISTYLHDDDGIYVNLYIPSSVTWKRNSSLVTLHQLSNYPFDERISFEVNSAQPRRFALRLRIPAWVGSTAAISVNGKPYSTEARPGSFASINRTWSAKDRVELTLPLTLRLQEVDPETPRVVALMRGPLVLFPLGDDKPVEESALLSAERIGPTEWLAKTSNGDVHLRAFTAIQDQQYRTYSHLT
jgi:uncharacterized protein